jgi:hypothetical protein
MAKTAKNPFIPKTRLGQKYYCYFRYTERAHYGRNKSIVGMEYKLIDKTSLGYNIGQPVWLLVPTERKKNGDLPPAIAIPAAEFASYFCPATK